MKIKGVMEKANNEVEHGEWSVDEIASFIENGHHAMLRVKGYYLQEKKDEYYASARALTLFPGETIPYVKGNDLVVPTSFRSMYLPNELKGEREDELINVNCIIPTNDQSLFISISYQ